MNYGASNIFWFIYSMVFIRCSGSGSSGPKRPGLTDDDIRELIATEVLVAVQGAIPEVFGSIKTVMIELFDERYADMDEVGIAAATTTIVVVAGV